MSDIMATARNMIKELLETFATDLIDELEDLKTTSHPEYNDGLQAAQDLIWDLKKDYENES